MKRYIARRLILVPVVLFGMTFITFFISQFVTTDPLSAYIGARNEPGGGDPKAIQALKEKWGWDKPIYERYLLYLQGLSRGDMGDSSSSRRPVAQDLAQYTPATIELVIATLIVALGFAIPVGVLTASRRGGRIDAVFKVATIIVVSVPVFVWAFIALDVFYRGLGLATGPGRLDVFLTEPKRITGLIVVDSILAGKLDTLLNGLHHLALPACLLGLVTGVYFARIIRSEMAEALESDYVRTARGKGLRHRLVLYRHALRNALIPVVTLSGLAFGGLLTGAIVVESIFGWPGLGFYAYRSATKVDLPAITGVTLVVGTIYLLINVAVDVTYAAIDPRVRIR